MRKMTYMEQFLFRTHKKAVKLNLLKAKLFIWNSELFKKYSLAAMDHEREIVKIYIKSLCPDTEETGS